MNVGRPQALERDGQRMRSAIIKVPVAGRVAVRRLNLDGDGQADLRVHGGPQQAVYVYAAEHYEYWQRALGRPLPFGQFGENLTAEGLLEDLVHVGDVFRAGNALLRVTRPRLPCKKLAARMGEPDFMQRFLESGRTGFYLEVLAEGDVGAGDAIRRLRTRPEAPTVLAAARELASS